MHGLVASTITPGHLSSAVQLSTGASARVGVLKPLDGPEQYDARVAAHRDATIFHSSAWLRVLQETYGFNPLCFATKSGSLLPVTEVPSRIPGRRGISLPFTDACSPLVSAPEDFRELWDGVLDYGRKRGWKSVELRGAKELLPEAKASVSMYAHVLDLAPEKSPFDSLHSSVRRAVRKAQNSGVTTERRTDVEGLRAYYALHCKTRKRHGLPPQPWAFFLNIQRHILSKGLGSLILARNDEIFIAGAVFFHMGQKALYKFGASDEMNQSDRGNNLVMWEAIKGFAENGYEQLDFGRTSLGNEGLRRFKLGWGTREETLAYVKYSLRSESFVTEKDRSSGWHTRLFRKLPISWLRIAGTVLYRHTA